MTSDESNQKDINTIEDVGNNPVDSANEASGGSTKDITISAADIGKVDGASSTQIGTFNTTIQDGQLKTFGYKSKTVKGVGISADVTNNDKNQLNYQLQANYSGNNLNMSATYSPESYSVDGNYNFTTGNGANGSVSLHKDDNSYQADGSYNFKTDGGFEGSVNVHKDNNNQYISFSGNKAFNPNNVNNSSDTYKVRKEELLSSDSQVSFESKVGYNEGFYNNNSLMLKLPNNNILNTSYNIGEINSSISFGADLQDLKIDYSHDKTSKDNTQAVSDKLNTDLKTQKNQFNFNLSNVTTTTTGEDETITRDNSLIFGSSVSLNRNEYGDFAPGLSGEFTNSLSLQNGKISGYSFKADGAYNRYNVGSNHDTDYLLSGSVSYSNNDNQSTLETNLASALRFNNCRTIFEPSVAYTLTNFNGTEQQALVGKLGIFQQVGKNFGDASVYTSFRGGKEFQDNNGSISSNWFGSIVVGGEGRISNKVTLTGKSTYDSKDKFSGEIGARIMF